VFAVAAARVAAGMLVTTLGGPGDFDPLLARVGNARVVMLGEATHGTGDFYRLREQLTRRLISEHGFTFVAVEGDWPDCDRVHRCVTDTPGADTDPRAALERIQRWPTWMWANTEVVRFCQWLRAYNVDRPRRDRVGFHGLDVYSLWESMQAIFDWLGEEDPAGLRAAQEAYRCFEPYGVRVEEYGPASRFVSARCEREVVALLSRIRARTVADGHRGPADDRHDDFAAWQNAEVVTRAEQYYRAMVAGGPRAWNVRDHHMTDTLHRLLEHHGPHSKAVVWAHNTHVGDARATDMADSGMVNLGQLARERYGDDAVLLVGFGGYAGQVVAAARWGAPAEVMPMPPGRPGSVEQRLHDLLPERATLVFAPETDLGQRPAWLAEPVGHRAVGVVYDPSFEQWGNYVPTRLADRYDAFVWCDRSGPVHPLPARARPGERETYPSGV
jgi:erythromycin esterase-like protein